jgi:RNA polymerase sigma-70 factor (ECF subfamily)
MSETGRLLRLVLKRPESADGLADLARAAVSGDRRAIRTLLITVTPHLLRVVRRVLRAEHPDVDDVAQESAFAFIEALPNHRGECTVLHFACRIAVLTAMNVRRRDLTKRRARKREDEVSVEAVATSSPLPDEKLLAQARADAVRELLDTLPIEQAEALAMHFVLGYTMREISEASATPVETVRSRLRLAKRALRERVAEDEELENLIGEEA